jgi:hypothetical protein
MPTRATITNWNWYFIIPHNIQVTYKTQRSYTANGVYVVALVVKSDKANRYNPKELVVGEDYAYMFKFTPKPDDSMICFSQKVWRCKIPITDL